MKLQVLSGVGLLLLGLALLISGWLIGLLLLIAGFALLILLNLYVDHSAAVGEQASADPLDDTIMPNALQQDFTNGCGSDHSSHTTDSSSDGGGRCDGD